MYLAVKKKPKNMAIQHDNKVGNTAVVNRDITIIAQGTQITDGTLLSQNDIRIDGEFNGYVKTEAKLVIGDKSQVKADIGCSEIDIYGMCECEKLVAHLVTLRSSSKFKGSIVAVELLIERGASFNGTSQVVTEEEYNKLSMADKKVNPTNSAPQQQPVK